MKERIELGDEVRDRVTGFQGIATAKIDYLVGCKHIGVTRMELSGDGIPVPVQWIDEPQLEVVKKQAVTIEIGYEPETPSIPASKPMRRKSGGPSVAPPSRKPTVIR